MWVSRHSSGDCSWFCPYCPGLVSQDQESSRHLMTVETHHSRLSHYRLVDVVQVPCPSRMYQPAINQTQSMMPATSDGKYWDSTFTVSVFGLVTWSWTLPPWSHDWTHGSTHTLRVCKLQNKCVPNYEYRHIIQPLLDRSPFHGNLSFQSIHFWTNWFVSVKNQLFDSFAPFGRAQQSADPAATLHCVLQFNDPCFFITCT